MRWRFVSSLCWCCRCTRLRLAWIGTCVRCFLLRLLLCWVFVQLSFNMHLFFADDTRDVLYQPSQMATSRKLVAFSYLKRCNYSLQRSELRPLQSSLYCEISITGFCFLTLLYCTFMAFVIVHVVHVLTNKQTFKIHQLLKSTVHFWTNLAESLMQFPMLSDVLHTVPPAFLCSHIHNMLRE